MNTPNAHLWSLIKSMSPAEKRYYKTHFASEDSRHTSLFDLLNGQDYFDNETTRQSLMASVSVFKVIKAQLYEILIKSLIAQQGKRDLKSSIRLGLEEVDLLLEREQYERATKKLKSLAKTCKQYGLTLYQYEITERLHGIQYLEPNTTDRESRKYYEQLSLFQKILAQKQVLSSIQVELGTWTPFMPERHSVVNKLLKQLYNMKGEHLDFSNFISWYQSVASCHELLGKEAESITIRQDVLAVFEHQQHLQKELPLNYLRALRQAANANLGLPDIEKVKQLSFKARKHIAVFSQYSPHYIYFLEAQLQSCYLHHEWHPILGQLGQKCIHHIKEYRLESLKTATQIFVIIAATCLINEAYEQAIELLELAKQQKIQEKSLEYGVYLLGFCLLWESKEYHQLYQKTLKIKALLKQRKELAYSNLFNIHLQLFSDLSRKPYLVEEKAAATLFKIGEEPFDPLLHYYSLFNMERWLQAAAAKRKWREVL